MSDNYIQCLDCQKLFPTKNELLNHQEFGMFLNKRNEWQCECCRAEFAGKFQYHVSYVPEDDLCLHCTHCSRFFPSKTELSVHIITKHFEQKLECEMPRCESKFRHVAHYIRHLKTTHRQVNRLVVEELLVKVRELQPDYYALKYI